MAYSSEAHNQSRPVLSLRCPCPWPYHIEAYDSSQLNPVAWFSSVQLDKHAIFIVLAQIKQVSGVGGLASLAIKDYILQF